MGYKKILEGGAGGGGGGEGLLVDGRDTSIN